MENKFDMFLFKFQLFQGNCGTLLVRISFCLIVFVLETDFPSPYLGIMHLWYCAYNNKDYARFAWKPGQLLKSQLISTVSF